MRLVLLILAALAALPASATAPAQLVYQGRVKEAGLPVTGSRNVDIYICPGAAVPVGSCYDTGVQVVSVVNGLFRATFSAPDGNPPTGVNWESGAQYLQLEVNGVQFTPRELISAAPYAVYSSSASTLVVNPGDPAVFISPNVAIAGDSFSVGGSTFAVKGSSVGVRTSSPSAALDVNGDLRVNGTVTVDGAGHVRVTGTGASTPIPGAGCGAGPTIAGSDTAGRITLGGAPVASTCVIVFGTQWLPNAPVCHFTDETGNNSAIGVAAVDTLSVTMSGGLQANGVYSYLCLSY